MSALMFCSAVLIRWSSYWNVLGSNAFTSSIRRFKRAMPRTNSSAPNFLTSSGGGSFVRFRGGIAVFVHGDHYRTGAHPAISIHWSFLSRQRTIERALAHGLARVLGGKQRAHYEDRGPRHNVPRRGGTAMAEALWVWQACCGNSS